MQDDTNFKVSRLWEFDEEQDKADNLERKKKKR